MIFRWRSISTTSSFPHSTPYTFPHLLQPREPAVRMDSVRMVSIRMELCKIKKLDSFYFCIIKGNDNLLHNFFFVYKESTVMISINIFSICFAKFTYPIRDITLIRQISVVIIHPACGFRRQVFYFILSDQNIHICALCRTILYRLATLSFWNWIWYFRL